MKRWIFAGVVLAAAAPARADDAIARDADGWCGRNPGEILVRDGAGLWHRVADDRPRTDDEGQLRQAWTGDLDGDGRKDLIVLHLAGCGAHECMFEAFVACADGTYATVMAPAYGDTVRVRAAGKRAWQRIETRSVGESKVPRERYAWSPHRFGADGYQ